MSLPRNKVIHGDALSVWKTFPADSVHCCVTSPPYYGLRDYKVEGSHWPHCYYSPMTGAKRIHVQAMRTCLGHEPDIESFIGHMVLIFREVHRVLHPTGTLWLNMGDTYAGSWGGYSKTDYEFSEIQSNNAGSMSLKSRPPQSRRSGIKEKNLMGMPWRLALALQADGWYLRSECIWSKPNPMPESVEDRPTKAHEHIFLFSKSEKYFYDHVAVMEETTGNAHPRGNGVNPKATENAEGSKQNASFSAAVRDLVTKRNLRTVWNIPTYAYPGAHFATFPPRIPEIAVLAGTSAKGCCARCAAPYKRVFKKKSNKKPPSGWDTGPGGHREGVGRYKHAVPERTADKRLVENTKKAREAIGQHDDHFAAEIETLGWVASCECGPLPACIPCVVADPFMGSGTTAEVAAKMGREFVGSELSAKYVELIHDRLGLFAMIGDGHENGHRVDCRGKTTAEEKRGMDAGAR